MLKMSPIVMWQIENCITKQNNPPLPKMNLWKSLYKKVALNESFCKISDFHFYNNGTLNSAAIKNLSDSILFYFILFLSEMHFYNKVT